MNEILELLVKIILAVAGFSVFYQLIPFKHHKQTKPKLAIFPKYVACFESSVDEIEQSLAQLEFILNEEGLYTRSKAYGDFAAKNIKLSVEVDEQAKKLKVYSPFIGILFDTGDLWQVTSDILNKNNQTLL